MSCRVWLRNKGLGVPIGGIQVHEGRLSGGAVHQVGDEMDRPVPRFDSQPFRDEERSAHSAISSQKGDVISGQ